MNVVYFRYRHGNSPVNACINVLARFFLGSVLVRCVCPYGRGFQIWNALADRMAANFASMLRRARRRFRGVCRQRPIAPPVGGFAVFFGTAGIGTRVPVVCVVRCPRCVPAMP